MTSFNLFGFYFSKTKPNEISPQPTWICIYDKCYLQTNDSLIKLVFEIIKEYKSDKHLVG